VCWLDQYGHYWFLARFSRWWPRFTKIWPKSTCLAWLTRSVGLINPKWKPGASQPTPRKENVVPRFDNKIRVIASNNTMDYKRRNTYLLTLLSSENSDRTKDTWCSPHCLNDAHDEVGDECVHEKLRADRFCLRCRGTFLPASSEATRTTPSRANPHLFVPLYPSL
jgi:hypothetical protein